jgi:hypothetical protein
LRTSSCRFAVLAKVERIVRPSNNLTWRLTTFA